MRVSPRTACTRACILVLASACDCLGRARALSSSGNHDESASFGSTQRAHSRMLDNMLRTLLAQAVVCAGHEPRLHRGIHAHATLLPVYAPRQPHSHALTPSRHRQRHRPCKNPPSNRISSRPCSHVVGSAPSSPAPLNPSCNWRDWREAAYLGCHRPPNPRRYRRHSGPTNRPGQPPGFRRWRSADAVTPKPFARVASPRQTIASSPRSQVVSRSPGASPPRNPRARWKLPGQTRHQPLGAERNVR